MLVHLFSSTSSPSCENYTLKKTTDYNKEDFHVAAVETVKRNFYVEDFLCSVAAYKQAFRLAGQLHELLSKGGFRLTKWISNSRKVIISIPESEKRTLSQGALPQQEFSVTERALGVQWNVQADTLSFKIASKEKLATRRATCQGYATRPVS